MNTFATLLRREWLEARLPFLWLPVGALGFLIVTGLMGILISGTADVHFSMTSSGDEATFFLIDTWSDRDVTERMAAFRTLVTAPFLIIYLLAALFVLLGSLYDDRRDRSVLFWKSMPVNDYLTVASKFTLAIVIAPLVMLACALVAQLFLLIVGTLFISSMELGDTGRLWASAGLIGGSAQMLLGCMIQVLWTLPITGYLMLISATVNRLTLLWALLIPVALGIAEFLLFRTRFLATGIDKHLEPAALPNIIGDDERIMPVVRTVGEQLSLLVNPDLWFGVVLGLAFLYGAVRMRGLRNEI